MLLVVHGGAGKRKPSKIALKKLMESLKIGYEILKDRGTAVDAVVNAITVLEDSGVFNAGIGGNLQLDGIRRLDAAVMDGKSMKVGSVIGVEGIRNPIKLAKAVMDLPNIMFTNLGARKIASKLNLKKLPTPDRKSLDEIEKLREKSLFYKNYFSTVGAVAIDYQGNLAAGTSTGGIRSMLPGRVGDSPIIGAGLYAENSIGAVSCTGLGEYIIRLSLAKEICMNLKTMPLSRAIKLSLKRIKIMGGEAGVIVINNKGNFKIMHTTEHMVSGYVDKRGIIVKTRFEKI